MIKVISVKFHGGALVVSNGPEEEGVPGVTVSGHFTPRYAASVVLGRVDHPHQIVDIGETRVHPAGWSRQELQSAIEAELDK